MSVILYVAPDGATIAGSAFAPTAISAKTQFFVQVKINYTSQLINGVFKALQNYLSVLVA